MIREICDRYDVLFIADEVMTGWGRTGKMWGIEHWGVTPDIIATAKGMTAGYTPLSAIIARDEIWQALERNHSAFKAGHTLNANAVSCAGAIAVINYSLSHDLAGNAAARGEQALAGLSRPDGEASDHRRCARPGPDVRLRAGGRPRHPEPFPPARKVSACSKQPALRHGLVTYPCTGTVDGGPGDMVLMAPPAGHHRAGDGRGAGHPRSGGGRGRRDARGSLRLRSIMLALRPHLKSGEP